MLVAPVTHRTELLSLGRVATARHAPAEKSRAGRLDPEGVRGGAFTLTNLRMYGVDALILIPNPPQSAILAAGTTKERPVREGGAVIMRPTMHLTLRAGHRVVDGDPAALSSKTCGADRGTSTATSAASVLVMCRGRSNSRIRTALVAPIPA